MNFTSLNFFIFFPTIISLFYLTPTRFRWITLLLGSWFFYANVKPVFLLLIVSVTFTTWFFSNLIKRTRNSHKKLAFLWISISLVLFPLLFFKYFGPINDGLIKFLTQYNFRFDLPEINLFLPVGISFYTFMAIGYTIDVYNDEIENERNPGILALFISFFPIVLSGPIERAKNMLPQFRNAKALDYSNISKGLKIMLWGYFMKLVVADRLGIYIDAVYNNLIQHNGTTCLLASILYPFQVYADLGGYSLIAIGISKIMGFTITENFKRPFFSTSMAEFWRRWHISLISWLTDYIYTPLSFSFRRYGRWGIVLALMITFFISGLWHGAALTFVIWGVMQGCFLSLESLTNKRRSDFERRHKLNNKSWYILLGCLITFIMFDASQIFGRSPDLQTALTVYLKIFSEQGPLYIDMTTLAYSLAGLIVLIAKDFIDEFFPNKVLLFENKNVFIRYISYLGLLFYILSTGILNNSQFIYFQF